MVAMSQSDMVPPSAALVRARLAEAIAVKQRMIEGGFADQAVEVAQAIIGCLRAGGKVIFFGNGGSAQDAGHLAAELMGRFAFDRRGLPPSACRTRRRRSPRSATTTPTTRSSPVRSWPPAGQETSWSA